jgi:hypothetical protein
MQVLKALSDDGVKLVNLGANGTSSRSTIVAARSQRSPVKKKARRSTVPFHGARLADVESGNEKSIMALVWSLIQA